MLSRHNRPFQAANGRLAWWELRKCRRLRGRMSRFDGCHHAIRIAGGWRRGEQAAALLPPTAKSELWDRMTVQRTEGTISCPQVGVGPGLQQGLDGLDVAPVSGGRPAVRA